MSEANNITLRSYEGHVQEYIDGSPQKVEGVVKDWLDTAIKDLPLGARILELGSASGRDALYLQSLGYVVACSDAAEGFVAILRDKGLNARKLDAIHDDLEGPYDLVFATAVLLHFTRQETARVLKKVFEALNQGGRFAFTLKQGEGETWVENKVGAPRYFCFWTKDQIATLLADSGYSEVQIEDNRQTRNATWLQIIAVK